MKTKGYYLKNIDTFCCGDSCCGGRIMVFIVSWVKKQGLILLILKNIKQKTTPVNFPG